MRFPNSCASHSVACAIALIAGLTFIGTATADDVWSEAAVNTVMAIAEAWDERRQLEHESEVAELEERQRREDEEQARKNEAEQRAAAARRRSELEQVRRWPGLLGLTPPLRPGEVVAETLNGCAIVGRYGDKQTLTWTEQQPDGSAKQRTGTPQEAANAQYGPMVWTGDCPLGLAQGTGKLEKPETLLARDVGNEERYFGRSPQVVTYKVRDSSSRFYWSDGESAGFADGVDLLKPVWTGLSGVAGTTFIIPGDRRIEAVTEDCEKAVHRGCRKDGSAKAYGMQVRVANPATSGSMIERRVWCPDPLGTVGCEAMWQREAGPYIEELTAFVARVEQEEAARHAEWPQWHAAYAQQYEARLAARRAEEDARKRAQVEARRAEEAARLAAEEAFQGKLQTANAGQLFALADELKARGDATRARQALRALVARFPEHQLAVSAATLLSAAH
jgi:hypothetical protein